MKVCFVGAGSIGKRHIKNFKTVCTKFQIDSHIHLLRSSNRVLDADVTEYINKQCYNYEELDCDYDAIFITNPTHLHYECIKQLKNNAKCFFVEKPVFDKTDIDIAGMELPSSNLYYVACPLRYTNVLLEAKKIIDSEPVFSARAISSSYLPDWRPNADYRKVYSAHKDQGGGVRIDLIHEWDYLISMFGFPDSMEIMYGKFSNLEINSEDLAIYIAKYRDKLIEVHLDYFGRTPKRELELYTSSAVYHFDIINSCIKKNNSIVQSFHEEANDKYLREMEYFLNLILGKEKSVNDLLFASKVLKTVTS